MKKMWIAVAAIAVVAIEICILILGIAKDKTAPIITVYQEKIAYSMGCSDDVILAGIVAKDNKDGDVSKNAIVVSRSIIQADKLERVNISASDNSGNVTTTKLLFAIEDEDTFKVYDASKYTVDMENLQFRVDGSSVTGELSGYEVITKPNKGDKSTEDANQMQSTEPEETEPIETEPIETEPAQTEPQSTEEITTDEPTTEEPTTKETPTVGEDGRPVIELKQTEITLPAGSSQMRLINCINEIYDDKDSRDTLFRRIGFRREPNLSQPGEYTVGLFCTDTDGNVSEIVELKVIVE
ncbi:MAG: hypothetical protein IJD58_12740 [Lachnospiraceae bacterium]|nr:hypothetical protein [Lachnospiraceae bacterium]